MQCLLGFKTYSRVHPPHKVESHINPYPLLKVNPCDMAHTFISPSSLSMSSGNIMNSWLGLVLNLWLNQHRFVGTWHQKYIIVVDSKNNCLPLGEFLGDIIYIELSWQHAYHHSCHNSDNTVVIPLYSKAQQVCRYLSLARHFLYLQLEKKIFFWDQQDVQW